MTDQLQQEIRNTQAEAGAGRGDPSSSTNTAASAQSASAAEQPGRANQPSSADPAGRPNAGSAGGSRGGAGANGPGDLNRLLDQRGWRRDGPLAGDDFVSWSDRLRDVEEMIDEPALRNQVAAARERARVLRQGIKRDHKKPDWDVIRLQIVNPLAEVRDRIADELARRQSREALVPIYRDPVPSRYSELVRRYYEKLGKDK